MSKKRELVKVKKHIKHTDKLDEILDLHKQFLSLANKALSIAIDIGRKLVQVKKSLPHGEFNRWCETS